MHPTHKKCKDISLRDLATQFSFKLSESCIANIPCRALKFLLIKIHTANLVVNSIFSTEAGAGGPEGSLRHNVVQPLGLVGSSVRQTSWVPRVTVAPFGKEDAHVPSPAFCLQLSRLPGRWSFLAPPWAAVPGPAQPSGGPHSSEGSARNANP